MKSFNHFRITALVLGLAAGLLSPGCAHVQPVVNDDVTCSGQTIPAADVQMIYTDLSTKNYADLVANVLPLLHDGWNDLVCVIDALEAQNPQLKPAAAEFKSQHAVEIRSAQPVSLRSPGTAAPPVGPTAQASTISLPKSAGRLLWTYDGPNVGAVAAACNARCGGNDGIASTYDNCQCWRKDKREPRGHWVTPASSTPGEGASARWAVAGGEGRLR